MVGAERRPKSAGRDLTSVIRNPNSKKWDDITFSRIGSWVGAFDSRYKFIVDNTDAEPWLLDLKEDPDENEKLLYRQCL